MSVVAVIQADLDRTPLGTKSRLAQEMAGAAVLRRTVDRVAAVKTLSGIFVLIPEPQADRCRRLLDGSSADVRPFNAPPAPWAALVRASRKWSLNGWRGGIGGSTAFDEYVDPRILHGLLKDIEADGVLCVPPAAPLFDIKLADAMIAHRAATRDDTRMVFTQAPPGICGILLDVGLVRELGESNTPVGWVFNYKPDQPQKDLVFHPCNMEIPARLRYLSTRLCADTERSWMVVRDHITDGATDEECIVQRCGEREETGIDTLPREIEIELTTDDPFPEALLRPRGDRVGKRGPIDPAITEKIAAEIARFDDSLVVLGGFGDPLRHPWFPDIIAQFRPPGGPARAYGLCVRTAAVDLDEAAMDILIRHEVDVLNVIIDAWSPEMYQRMNDLASVHGASHANLEALMAKLDQLEALRRDRGSAVPILVPEFTKSTENLTEMDAFFDGWIRRTGTANLVGVSHYARQLPDRGVIKMAPSVRNPCYRIRSRCLVLADGRVAACDQDFRGLHAFASLHESSLAEIWLGASMKSLRQAHAELSFDQTLMCAACEEWHRP